VPVRKLIYTNAIESLNARYRRGIKARGHFPSEQAMKILYLTVRERRPNRSKPHRQDHRLEEHPEHPRHHLRPPRQYQLAVTVTQESGQARSARGRSAV
jgi:hypothetical protein